MNKNITKTGFDPALLGASSSSSPNIWTLVSSLLALVITGSVLRRRYVLFLAPYQISQLHSHNLQTRSQYHRGL
jgi:hypothetical protein